jgi:antitoxin component of RelBE/YafQ-DinJ toxin-antitoxin module
MSVVSVRIDRKVKEILEKAGVDIGKEVKKFLEELAWKIEVRQSVEKLSKLLEKIHPAEVGFSAKSVREDRESH